MSENSTNKQDTSNVNGVMKNYLPANKKEAICTAEGVVAGILISVIGGVIINSVKNKDSQTAKKAK